MRTIVAFWGCRAGATSIEYALIAGFLSLAVVAGATKIGVNLNARFFGPVSSGLN